MNDFSFMNYFFKRTFRGTFIYYTYWGLLIQLLYYIGVLKKYQESVLLVVITVSVIGAIITYVYPRRISLPDLDIYIDNKELQIMDLFVHQIPLLVLLIVYDSKIKPDNLYLAALSLLVYSLIFNPLYVYDFDNVSKNNRITSKTNKFLNDNKYRHRMAIFMILIYFVIILLAIKTGIFK